MAALRLWRLATLLLSSTALVPPSATHQRSPGRRRRDSRIARYASPDIEDRLALGGDVAVLFLYSYTQKSLDTIYAVTANYVEGIEVDEMDCFRDPSFAAAALSLAWLCGALALAPERHDEPLSREAAAAQAVPVQRVAVAPDASLGELHAEACRKPQKFWKNCCFWGMKGLCR